MPIDDRIGREDRCFHLKESAAVKELAKLPQQTGPQTQVPPGSGWQEVVGRSHGNFSGSCYSFARSRYSPVRVSILMRSPMLTNTGHWNSAPVSTLHGFETFVAVLPRAPGSQYSIFRITWFGGVTLIGLPLYSTMLQTIDSLRNFHVSPTWSAVNSCCS